MSYNTRANHIKSSQVLLALGYLFSTCDRGARTMSDHTLAPEQTQEIPYGYCQCGCGQLAPIAKSTRRDGSVIEGQPRRFAQGHSGRRRLSPEEYFWQNVEKGAPNECWLWKGTVDAKGYGRFYFNSLPVLAHRLSYELHTGPIPKGLLICHHCDVKLCCNPDHLYAGTHKDNNRDRVTRARGMKTITYRGKTLTASEWSKETGLSAATIRLRLARGWSAGRILTTPTHK